MFSSAVEVVLTIAYREAVSRRHAYVTLEHLLYALARQRRRADPGRLRGRSAEAAARPRRVSQRVARADEARRRARAGADGRVPPRAADRGAPCAERAARRSGSRR